MAPRTFSPTLFFSTERMCSALRSPCGRATLDPEMFACSSGKNMTRFKCKIGWVRNDLMDTVLWKYGAGEMRNKLERCQRIEQPKDKKKTKDVAKHKANSFDFPPAPLLLGVIKQLPTFWGLTSADRSKELKGNWERSQLGVTKMKNQNGWHTSQLVAKIIAHCHRKTVICLTFAGLKDLFVSNNDFLQKIREKCIL